MWKNLFLIVSIILASACVQNSPPNLTSDLNSQIQPAVNETTKEGTVQPLLQDQGELGGISTVPAPQEQQPEAPKEPGIVSFVVVADDNGLYPQTIVVPKGVPVELTFNVREQNVYYGGLDFRSSKFTTGTVLAGKEITVQFAADESFRYASYWPASNRKKADGIINVQTQG